MFSIDGLRVSAGGADVLNGVSLSVPDGELHAIFGPNGTGKSVLLGSLMGYPQYEVKGGRVELDGLDLLALPIHERARLGVGMAEQRPPVVRSVRYGSLVDIIVPPGSSRRASVDEAAERYDVRRFFDRPIHDGLSGGESKCAELFLLLIQRPRLLILDEPDSGVDPERLKVLATMIRECLRGDPEPPPCMVRNSGLVVTHSAAILEYLPVDKAHVLMDGRVRCSGNPRILMDHIQADGYERCVRADRKGARNGRS